MTDELISICLPKGDALKPLSKRLDEIGFPISGYDSANRTYRPEVGDLPVRAKIMAEKDVAIQVAVKNYDIGFCGMDWIEEHTIRYRAAGLTVYSPMNMLKKNLHACAGLGGDIESVDDLLKRKDFITIVSEYPNLAENFAIRKKLRKFKIFSAWGSVEGYPPEHADIVLLTVYADESLEPMGLRGISRELESELCMVLNRVSFVEKDLSPVLEYFSENR